MVDGKRKQEKSKLSLTRSEARRKEEFFFARMDIRKEVREIIELHPRKV